ncbi:MAG: histidine triad nucleotide-binding protein [Actinomycetota bacterium]|jgi:histidine triad (HIT) family protein
MNCIFCKIVSGEIPSKFLYEGERVVAFEDLNPQAPTHILIVPKSHHENAADLSIGDPSALLEIFKAAKQLANKRELEGYRTVFNTGAAAGQSVFHAHLHLLGGRAFGWPPG